LSTTTEISVAGANREALAELAAGGDIELGIDSVEVRADRAVRQEEPLADLPVR